MELENLVQRGISVDVPHVLPGQGRPAAFSTLVGLFDRMGLRNNASKTVGMVCRPCQAVGTQSEVAYGQLMTGEGPSYQECQKVRVK